MTSIVDKSGICYTVIRFYIIFIEHSGIKESGITELIEAGEIGIGYKT